MAEIPFPYPPLRADTVALRAWRDDDVDAIVAALQDPEIPRWTNVPAPYGKREAREFVLAVEPERVAGRSMSLAIVDAEGGAVLGATGLTCLDRPEGTAEIGYWIAAAARRRGAGTAGVTALSRWALGSAGFARLEILVNPANEPSLRLAASAGFRREGLLRSYRERRGMREDLVMFALLPGDL